MAGVIGMSPIGLCKDPFGSQEIGSRAAKSWVLKPEDSTLGCLRQQVSNYWIVFDPQHLPTLNFTHADNFMDVFTQKIRPKYKKKKNGHYSLFSDFFYSDWHKQKKINVSGMILGLLSVLTVNHF